MTLRPSLAVLAATVAVAGFVVVAPGRAGAETQKVEFAQDGTFWRLQPRNPVVDVPCTLSPRVPECGQVAPTAGVVSSPNVTDGNMVVAHAGGLPGADKGDQFWIVSQPDVASLGAVESIDKLTLSFTKAADNRGDFGTPVIKACNIVTAFGVGEGTNPWDDRPQIDCSNAVVPKVSGAVYTFDVTQLANTWIGDAPQGYGIAIVPGLPGTNAVVNNLARLPEYQPFQITFVNANKADANRKPVPERATGQVSFTAADEFGDDTADEGGLALDDFSTDETGLGDVSTFDGGGTGDEFASGISDGTDVGPIDASPSAPLAAPRLARAAHRPGFAWALLLVLPLLALAIWGAGSALGPLGDPIAVRQGGVARLVALRRARRSI